MNSINARREYRFIMPAMTAIILVCVFLLHSFPAMAKSKAKSNELQKVKTIQWSAKATRDLSLKNKAGVTAEISTGTKVVVTKRGYGPTEGHTIRYEGNKFWVPHGAVSFIADLCSVKKEGDYNKLTKEWFVNEKHRVRSKTDYLIWTSLDKQRTYVYHRDNGRWNLIRTMKCSTGQPEKPTRPSFSYDVSFKERFFTYDCGEGLHTYSYYVEYSGSGYHVWPGGSRKGIFGQHTVSSGCIRLDRKNAKWLFKTIPVGTKVIVW